VLKYGLTVNLWLKVTPSSLKELLGLTSVPSTLMRMDTMSLALALAPLIITWVLALFNVRPVSLVYLTMASASRCSSFCSSLMSSATTKTAVLSAWLLSPLDYLISRARGRAKGWSRYSTEPNKAPA
jgi:hypothetical protein